MSIVGYGLGRDTDVADFHVAFGFGRFLLKPIPAAFTHIIREDFRRTAVFMDDRNCIVGIDERNAYIKIEHRSCIVEEESRSYEIKPEDRTRLIYNKGI
jgi:hypothetical protein